MEYQLAKTNKNIIPVIKFQEREFLFISAKKSDFIDFTEPNDGSIATVDEYKNFKPSYAYLYDSGLIKRNGNIIGTKEDIIFAGWADVIPNDNGIEKMLEHCINGKSDSNFNEVLDKLKSLIDGLEIIEAIREEFSEKGTCELCSKVTDLRPYGPNDELICYECGIKDEKTTQAKHEAYMQKKKEELNG